MYRSSCPGFESWTFWFCKQSDRAEKATETLCIPAGLAPSPCGAKRSLWGQSVVHCVWRLQDTCRSSFSPGLSVSVDHRVKSLFLWLMEGLSHLALRMSPIYLKMSWLKSVVLANGGWRGRDHIIGLSSGPRDAAPIIDLWRRNPQIHPSLLSPHRNILE